MKQRPKILEMWLVLAYQHGRPDTEMPDGYETEAEAMEAASGQAAEIPWDENTEHEFVVFKAVATYRGRRLQPFRYLLEAKSEEPRFGKGKAGGAAKS